MAVIGITDVTTTILTRQWNYGMLMTTASVSVAAGSYGLVGIPMPSYNVLGMRRQIDWLHLTEPVDASAALYLYRYSVASHMVHLFEASESASNAFAGMGEIASGTSLSIMSFRIACIGR